MAEETATIHGYGSFIEKVFDGKLESLQAVDTVVRCALMDENLTHEQSDRYWLDVKTHEIEGREDYDPEDHYSPVDLENKEIFFDEQEKEIYFRADNITYGDEVTLTASYMVIFVVDDENIDDSPLMLFVDLEEERSSLNGRFEVNWHEDGLFYISI